MVIGMVVGAGRDVAIMEGRRHSGEAVQEARRACGEIGYNIITRQGEYGIEMGNGTGEGLPHANAMCKCYP